MNTLSELVPLPDPRSQALVHPLDLPQARPAFRRAWLLGVLAHPTVYAATALLLLRVSDNLVTPFLAPLLLPVAALAARRFLLREAWAFIPRGRQDRHRPLPPGWTLGAPVLHALALGVAVVSGLAWLTQIDVSPGVRGYVLGSLLALTFLILLEVAHAVFRDQRDVLRSLPKLLVLLASAPYAVEVLSQGQGLGALPPRDVLLGAGVLLLVQVGWWLGTRFTRPGGPVRGRR